MNNLTPLFTYIGDQIPIYAVILIVYLIFEMRYIRKELKHIQKNLSNHITETNQKIDKLSTQVNTRFDRLYEILLKDREKT